MEVLLITPELYILPVPLEAVPLIEPELVIVPEPFAVTEPVIVPALVTLPELVNLYRQKHLQSSISCHLTT